MSLCASGTPCSGADLSFAASAAFAAANARSASTRMKQLSCGCSASMRARDAWVSSRAFRSALQDENRELRERLEELESNTKDELAER